MNNADRLAAYFDPDMYNSLRPTAGVDLRFHPQLEVLNQGTSWHGAGVATTPFMHEAIAEAERALYPEGIRMTQIRTWQTSEPEFAFLEWRNEAPMYNGRLMRNGGLSMYQFEDGAVRKVRHFINTAYAQAVERGWEELVSYDTLLKIPAYHTLSLPVVERKPFHPADGYRFEDEPELKFEKPWTNEQRVAMMFDPPAFDMHGPARPDAPFYTFTDDAYMEWQGTKWAAAGRNRIKDRIAARELDGVFEPHTWLRFTHTRTWATSEQDWVFMEWFSKSDMWTGLPFLNHGMTALWFESDGVLKAHREYNDVIYNEMSEGDWREKAGPEYFAALATSKTWDLPSGDWVPTPIE